MIIESRRLIWVNSFLKNSRQPEVQSKKWKWKVEAFLSVLDFYRMSDRESRRMADV